jgi:HEAT repeat protein
MSVLPVIPVAIALAVSITGCAEGPLWRAGYISPWVRQKWQDDEKIATTLIAKREDMRGRTKLALKADQAEQQSLAIEFSEIAARDPVSLMRLEAVRLLGSLPVAEAAAGLRTATNDRELSVRMAAISGLGNHTDPESLQTLAGLSRTDENADVRVAATRELGKSDNQAAMSALEEALSDPDPAMQLTAAQALSKSTGQTFGNDIQGWLTWIAGNRSGSPEERVATERGPPDSFPDGLR